MSIIKLSQVEKDFIEAENIKLEQSREEIKTWWSSKDGLALDADKSRLEYINTKIKYLYESMDYYNEEINDYGDSGYYDIPDYDSLEWKRFVSIQKAITKLKRLKEAYEKIIEASPKPPKLYSRHPLVGQIEMDLKIKAEPFKVKANTYRQKVFINNSQYKAGDWVEFKSHAEYLEAKKTYHKVNTKPNKDTFEDRLYYGWYYNNV